MEIISDYLYVENKNFMPIERKVFQKLIFIVTQETLIFNRKLYERMDSVTYKNPLSP